MKWLEKFIMKVVCEPDNVDKLKERLGIYRLQGRVVDINHDTTLCALRDLTPEQTEALRQITDERVREYHRVREQMVREIDRIYGQSKITTSNGTENCVKQEDVFPTRQHQTKHAQ